MLFTKLLVLAAVRTAAACAGAGGTPITLSVPSQHATIQLAVTAAEADTSSSDIVIDIAAGDHDHTGAAVAISWSHGCTRKLTISGPASGPLARLLGGSTVSHSALTSGDSNYASIPTAMRSSVRVATLTSMQLGLTGGLSSVEGEMVQNLKVTEAVEAANSAAEPFLAGRPLWTAQWPNRIASPPANTTAFTWTRAAGAQVIQATNGDTRTVSFPFVASEAPFAAWTDWDDVYGLGFWEVDWAEGYLPIAFDSDVANSLELTFPTDGPEFEMSKVEAGARFAVLNSFDALDAEGEYVLKRNTLASASASPSASSATLYFIPPAASSASSTELVMSANSGGIFTIDSARGVTIENLSLEATRGAAIEVSDSNDVTLNNLIFANIGHNGITASGYRILVSRCKFTSMGRRAISIDGGVRATLTSGGNQIFANEISESPRRSLHYAEALELGGVGVIARRNLIYNSPSAIMEMTGNDHIVEYNVIHHVALDSFDTGAIHWAAYSPAVWGYTFNYNVMAYVGYKENPCSASTSCLVAGIYADDGSFGFEARGNVFYMPEPASRSWPASHSADWYSESVNTMGIFVNGGSRNTIEQNLVIGSKYLYGSSGGFLVVGGTGAAPPIASNSAFWTDITTYNWNTPGSVFYEAYPKMRTLRGPPVDTTTCNADPTCAAAPFGESVANNIGLDLTSAKGFELSSDLEYAGVTVPTYHDDHHQQQQQ